MITIKLFGGAKKSFSSHEIIIEHDNYTIRELLAHMNDNKLKNSPEFDINNLLIAVNGVDSSVMKGLDTELQKNDIVSIIPVIHGGSRTQFTVNDSLVELIEIKPKTSNIEFLDKLRKKFKKITLQGISPRFILNKNHAQKIISISINAKNKNILLSKKIETDILMRFACTTQIEEAINTIGIKENNPFIIIAIGKQAILNELFMFVKPYLKITTRQNNQTFLKKHFNMSNEQIGTIISKTPLEDLLVEKAAVLV